MGQSRIDNTEILITHGTQNTRQRQRKENCVGHHYAQTTQIAQIRHEPLKIIYWFRSITSNSLTTIL